MIHKIKRKYQPKPIKILIFLLMAGILFAASIAILSIVDTLSCFRTFDADKKIRAIWGYLRKPIIAMIPIAAIINSEK